MWFTEANADKIGRVTATGSFTTFPIPTADSFPTSIVTGPDGNLWFTEYNAGKIGRITPAGVITEFPIPTDDSGPDGITVGSDGNLWFTEFGANHIGSISTAGVITFTAPLPTTGTNSEPADIVTGPDGALWFIESAAEQIGRLTHGDYSSFSVGDHPLALAATASGLEVTDTTGGGVGDLATLVPQGQHAVILPTGAVPAKSTVRIGTIVEWTQLAPTSQTVSDASGRGLFSSGSLYPGSDYSFRFTAAGTYPYAAAPTGTSDLPPTARSRSSPTPSTPPLRDIRAGDVGCELRPKWLPLGRAGRGSGGIVRELDEGHDRRVRRVRR